ncbi:phage tail tube protein [Moraxella sp.]|jgi:predicted secreted protein|uniref:phage tail tube protein n=1 Tax=Moraxella sp. TaxID=479 RepID=UPI00263289DD|nr:phage tail tube protein [Moraxella sp.]MCP3896274.1 hypothetical protein [Moraxella sp.]
MANHKGSEGVVKVGTATIAELKSYSIEESAETIETTALSDAAKTFTAGTTSWSGSCDCYWDETDTTGQGALTAGAEVTMNFYPEGASTDDKYYTGTAIVDSLTVEAGQDDMVAASFSFTGNGALSFSTVS